MGRSTRMQIRAAIRVRRDLGTDTNADSSRDSSQFRTWTPMHAGICTVDRTDFHVGNGPDGSSTWEIGHTDFSRGKWAALFPRGQRSSHVRSVRGASISRCCGSARASARPRCALLGDRLLALKNEDGLRVGTCALEGRIDDHARAERRYREVLEVRRDHGCSSSPGVLARRHPANPAAGARGQPFGFANGSHFGCGGGGGDGAATRRAMSRYRPPGRCLLRRRRARGAHGCRADRPTLEMRAEKGLRCSGSHRCTSKRARPSDREAVYPLRLT